MKRVKLLFLALLSIVAYSTMTSCSNDDETDSNGFVGVWLQTGDDDIFVFENDGTFFAYWDEACYLRGEKRCCGFGTWKVTQNLFSLTFNGAYDEDGTRHEYGTETANWNIAKMTSSIIELKYIGGNYYDEEDFKVGDTWTLYRYNK